MKENKAEKKQLASVSADNLQGGEGAVHPKSVPYNHSRDHNTGGSCQSSDRGSNSTAGNSNRASSSAVEQILVVNDGPDVLSSFTRESKSKEGSSGPKSLQTQCRELGRSVISSSCKRLRLR